MIEHFDLTGRIMLGGNAYHTNQLCHKNETVEIY